MWKNRLYTHHWCWLAELLLLWCRWFRNAVLFSPFSCPVSVFHLHIRRKRGKKVFFMFLQTTQFYQSSDVRPGCTSVSFLSNSSNSASLILDRLRTSRFFWNKKKSWFNTFLFFFKRFVLQVWHHWCITLWRSDSCWCLIRASLLGNCLRHSRHAIFVQSVNFCWLSPPSKSATPSSGSLSPLYAATSPH